MIIVGWTLVRPCRLFWRRRAKAHTTVAPEFGEGLQTPPKRSTEGLPVKWRPSVGSVSRSETGHIKGHELRVLWCGRPGCLCRRDARTRSLPAAARI